MAIVDTINSMYENVGNVYDVLELAGADLTNVDKNIQNLKTQWEDRLKYYLANGLEVVWNNWNKITGSGTSLTLNNTIQAPMKIVYKGNTSQNGTPTPDDPIPVQVVSGDNSITIANNDNTQSQTYSINLGTIELCKIGDYQDRIYKDNGKWYLNKKIGKVVLNGSESNWNVVLSSNLYRAEKVFNILPYTDTNRHIGRFICSHFYPNINNEIGVIFQYKSIVLFYVPSGITTVEQWKTWLGNNNTTLYYVLETPTITEITDSTLIYQLEETKKSYNNQTNISQENSKEAFILDVTALGN